MRDNLQVATRFLSASPPLYWFASYKAVSPGKRWGYMFWAYSTAYILLGSLLFSNFYPFTWKNLQIHRPPTLLSEIRVCLTGEIFAIFPREWTDWIQISEIAITLSVVLFYHEPSSMPIYVFKATILLVAEYHNLRQRRQTIEGDGYPTLHEEHDLFQKPECLHAFVIPCTLHLGFMAATAFLVMHVQVRLILTC